MKTIRIFVLILIITSFSALSAVNAADWESYELVNKLLSMRSPGAPLIHENFVVFTADSSIRRIGAAFSHENFAVIHWYKTLLIPQDALNPILLPGEKIPSPYKDSGMQFCVYEIPEDISELKYRLVINGLWTIDPANPLSRRDLQSGLSLSVLRIPARPEKPHPLKGLPEGLHFLFKGPPGEHVTVAGSFNNWDPFMYELKEGPAGVYSITIPLPPGLYQYVFFHRGERYLDPYNMRRIFARDGSTANEIEIQ